MIRIFKADIFAGLSQIKNDSIDVAITSPPYWGQRDYGFEGQIGNEKSYIEYISKLIFLFNLLRKKLNPEGVFFLNIGDKYLSKYGNSTLAMIPYKLAYFMIKDGWILNDILIWFKPNHMPSSIKNRFANSYEPIFVFSKNRKNHFFNYKNSASSYSNILKLTLQPSSYKHVAAFPEKLIKNLMGMVKIDKETGLVLDPFAGSGTTLKVIQDINNNSKYFSSIMIENNNEYIEIIKDRCSLHDSNIINYEFKSYDFKLLIEEETKQLTLFENVIENYNNNRKGIIKIFNYKEDYYRLLSQFNCKFIKKYLDKDSLNFIGSKEFDIELIYQTSLLNQKGWVIRNLLVVQNENTWFPLFMIVDDNKELKYKFNYKALNLKHKNELRDKWKEVEFKGLRVVNNFLELTGRIIEIEEKYENGFPKYVIVKWNNDEITREFVVFSEEVINNNLLIVKDKNGFEKNIIEKKSIVTLNKKIINFKINKNLFQNGSNKVYNGKFKKEKRINWGASPGARSSMEESFFSVQRLYNVEQPIVSDYLNYKRKLSNLSKSDLTNLFPKSYKHTVGHWLRKDFGGSLPSPNDWLKLQNILDLDENFTNYVCKSALKLQTVKQSEYKLPKDFITIEEMEHLKKLII